MSSSIHRAFGLTACGIALLGLSQSSALAQSLALNKSATGSISGAGTAVNGTHTFGGGAGTATKSYFFVNAYDGSQLSVGKGASITYLNGYGSAALTVTGGDITNLTTKGDFLNPSSLTITGGNIDTLTNTGGSVGSLLSISGGTFGAVQNAYSHLSITGGSFDSLTTLGNNDTISGGSFGSVTNTGSSPFTISGGTFNFLSLGYSSQITGGNIGSIQLGGKAEVFGTNLVLNRNFQTGLAVLTGTLQDGEAIDANISGDFRNLTLQGVIIPDVPEASTTVSFALLLCLGAAGLVIRRKAGTKTSA